MPGVMTHFTLWALGLARPESQTTQSERNALARYAADRHRLAEIGVWHGLTTRLLRSVMAPDGVYFAIDPYPVGRLGFNTQFWIAHYEVRQVTRGRVVWLRTTGADAATDFLVRAAPIDFLFIDGDHTFDGLRADWEAWAGHIRANGVVALHDSRPTILRPIHDAGSVRYLNDVIRHDPRFEVVEEVDSLTILKRVG